MRITSVLKRGGVAVLPTDTIYGLVGQALKPKIVRRIYRVRRRNPKKPCIILIGSLKDLAKFQIKPDKPVLKILNKVWPGRVSVILPCPNPKFKYLHRGTNTLALRLPKKPSLIKLLKQTGPLVAPSANPEGLPPAKTITEAKRYFGDQVDFYLAGHTNKKPSRLIKIENGRVIVLRP